VADWETPHEKVIGSVSDLDTVLKAAEGVDAIVIAHMAPQGKASYSTPTLPYDVNVKGTANLFFAAGKYGIRRAALVSSGGAVDPYYVGGGFLSRDLPFKAKGLYRQTKVLQEMIAQLHHYEFGIGVAILRPGYIADMDTCLDKYGRKLETANWQFLDRRDIGEIALLALGLPDLGFEIFWTLSTPMGAKHADMEYVYKRLDWKPRYDFSNLKQDTR
jgi:nucleoside-diphosphate-sugar epimerase